MNAMVNDSDDQQGGHDQYMSFGMSKLSSRHVIGMLRKAWVAVSLILGYRLSHILTYENCRVSVEVLALSLQAGQGDDP